MTQEEKDLVLRDLCARLPYGVIGEYSWKKREPHNRELTGNLFDELKSSWDSTEDSEFLPYLRPMSSMTKEERIELGESLKNLGMTSDVKRLDWLLAHHFDIRNLIGKGLALEAPEGMYKID